MIDPSARRARGRPRERVLDVDRITDAALAVLKKDGLRGLTMRGVAARLGVTPSALYHHVPSRDALLAAVQERFAAGLDTSGFGTLPLREALSRWAWSYLLLLRAQPELVPVIVEVPLAQTPHTSLMYQRVIAGFAAAGWPEESIIGSMSVLETYIFGAALDSPSPDDVYAPGSSAREPLLARTYAAFSASVEDRGERPRDALFRLGVEAILTGLHQVWGSGRGWPGAPR
ncbi:TetR/AcrR family transcriptional regulator [Microbacterium sp. ASV49]|uniref:Helix-turn-helix domain-containing protein n=1 Tax=Microbacterium candidum TaxID=3041922 RepID=A0ABT7N4F8_9MICO|nr:helix-turn-helix domain-containing protein [Microbacterium sp. ASV49]MDL9981566.1 helix-turn-helix domain-containing protein [Microbacterium sp. ASV49]